MNDTVLQNLSQLETALAAQGLETARHQDVFKRLRTHLERYAALEKQLLGHVWITVPTHLLDLDLSDDPLEAGEKLAHRERARFDLGEGETGDVMSLFDREGIKVYRPRFPDRSQVDGVFLFDGEVGPVLVVNGRLPVKDGDSVFARLYAHYLVDNDPYVIRFALRGAEAGATEEEIRAQAFAAAFLISREGLATYLDALGHREGKEVTADTLRQLAVYFEVGFRPLLIRLLSMGVIGPQDLPPLLAKLQAADVVEEPPPAGAVGERFIRLALEAHARKRLDDEQLADYLETDRATAEELASRFRLEDGAAADDDPGNGTDGSEDGGDEES